MPNYKSHLVGGALAFTGTLKLTYSLWNQPTVIQIPVCLAICLLGSLFPDIDVTSKMQRLFYLAAAITLPVTLLYQQWTLFFVITGVAFFITYLRHRTLTHNMWFIISMPALLLLYLSHQNKAIFNQAFLWYLYFVAGALSHVILDKTVTTFKRAFK